MKKFLPLTILILVFLASLTYLHQKVNIYVEAYRLGSAYDSYNELVDKRDHLLYNFSKEVSIAKVNQWAQDQNFVLVEQEKVLSMNLKSSQPPENNKLVLLLDRFLGASVSTSTALAEEKE